MNDFRVRLAERNDTPALADMRWRLKTEDAPITDRSAYDAFVSDFTASQTMAGESSGVFHWLVENADRIVGAMSLVIVKKIPAPDEPNGCWGYLTNSYVYPEARDSGAGTQLLHAIKSWAARRNLELLIVWPSERAYPFYERAGFKSTRDPLVLNLSNEKPA